MRDLIPVPSPGVTVYVGTRGDPLVILVHDFFGRLPGLLLVAEALGSEGFFVAIPDLFNGVATRSSVEAEKLMTDIDVGIALAELDDIINDSRASGSQKVGVVGFSMGGWIALLHAQGGSVDAVVAYYASLAPIDHGVIPAPVLLHYAENDEWREGEDPVSFIERLDEHTALPSPTTSISARSTRSRTQKSTAPTTHVRPSWRTLAPCGSC